MAGPRAAATRRGRTASAGPCAAGPGLEPCGKATLCRAGRSHHESQATFRGARAGSRSHPCSVRALSGGGPSRVRPGRWPESAPSSQDSVRALRIVDKALGQQQVSGVADRRSAAITRRGGLRGCTADKCRMLRAGEIIYTAAASGDEADKQKGKVHCCAASSTAGRCLLIVAMRLSPGGWRQALCDLHWLSKRLLELSAIACRVFSVVPCILARNTEARLGKLGTPLR